jgi:hypothetical protein
VPQPFLPYALVTLTFPFRHLAALAGRAPIGGAREVALGCFMAARLAAECGRADSERGDEASGERAAAAKSWLGTLTLPAAVRAPISKVIESSAQASMAVAAHDVAAMRQACATFLDASSRAELDVLADFLNAGAAGALPGRANEP